jgi:hypothetical protein
MIRVLTRLWRRLTADRSCGWSWGLGRVVVEQGHDDYALLPGLVLRRGTKTYVVIYTPRVAWQPMQGRN